MKMLFVSDQFTKGGFESHIRTLCNELENQGHTCICAFARYEPIEPLKASIRIYKDFNFSSNPSIEEFITDVNKLATIVSKEEIEIIHANPYYALFPSIFASVITQKPIVLTLHGNTALNFFTTPIQSILFYQAMDSVFGHIFCMNNMVLQSLMECQVHADISLMLNPVKTDENIRNKKFSFSKKLCLVSRLDEDRFLGICKFIKELKGTNYEHLYICGDGNRKARIARELVENEMIENASFMGHNENWIEFAKENGCVVIGLGRVVVEALLHKIPVVLIGKTSGAKGLVDHFVLEHVKANNFIGDSIFEDISTKQLQSIFDCLLTEESEDIYDEIKSFDVNSVIKEYLVSINEAKYLGDNSFEQAYDCIKDIEDAQTKEFYFSQEVFWALQATIQKICLKPYIKNLFVLAEHSYSTSYNTYKGKVEQMEFEIGTLRNEEAKKQRPWLERFFFRHENKRS